MDSEKIPKTISVSMKCSDCFDMSVMDANNKCIADYDGYVPSYIPGSYGDYVEMDIDIETGRVLNWKNPLGNSEFQALLKGKSKDPKTISFSAKCRDGFSMSVMNAHNEEIASYCGYAPYFLLDEGGYDKFFARKIDIETGVLLNWKNPSEHGRFKAILEGREDEYESD